jgi:hypothetical protein
VGEVVYSHLKDNALAIELSDVYENFKDVLAKIEGYSPELLRQSGDVLDVHGEMARAINLLHESLDFAMKAIDKYEKGIKPKAAIQSAKVDI